MNFKNHSKIEKKRELADRLLIFLFAIVLVAMCGWQMMRLNQLNFESEIKDLEKQLDRDTFAAMHLKGVLQNFKMVVGYRADGVIVKDGVSYLVDDLQHDSKRGEYINGDGSAYEAILDFRDQLTENNISLIVMIVAGKSASSSEDVENLVVALKDADVDTVYAYPKSKDQFLKHDSHWRPALMDFYANRLSEVVATHTKDSVRKNGSYIERVLKVINKGDLVREGFLVQTAEEVELRQVVSAVDQPLFPEVLLLGDSYTNIYSAPEMGWGRSAGLGERLSFYMQAGCDVLAINGNGAHSSRKELLRNQALLEGKKVVVWQFAARELDQERWEKITFNYLSGESSKRVSFANEGDEKYEEYEIVAIPEWKRSSVYPTSLTEILLKRTRDNQEVLVKMLLKKNKVFTDVEKLSEGSKIRLKVSDYKKQRQYERSEMFLLNRYDLEVYWAEF